jgi:hypothetical protein
MKGYIAMSENIKLRWIHNNTGDAKKCFGGGRYASEFTYLGAPILADFELSYENLAPYVTEVLDLEIKGGKVKVW